MPTPTHTVEPGSWIQVSSYPVVSCDEQGNVLQTHGDVRAVAHVFEVESDGWVVAWFERTQTYASICPDNFIVLGGPDTGKHRQIAI